MVYLQSCFIADDVLVSWYCVVIVIRIMNEPRARAHSTSSTSRGMSAGARRTRSIELCKIYVAVAGDIHSMRLASVSHSASSSAPAKRMASSSTARATRCAHRHVIRHRVMYGRRPNSSYALIPTIASGTLVQ